MLGYYLFDIGRMHSELRHKMKTFRRSNRRIGIGVSIGVRYIGKGVRRIGVRYIGIGVSIGNV